MMAAGPFWTAAFFLLFGYVCAVNPLHLSNSSQGEAREAVASSAFRRVWRIGVPAALGMLLSFVLRQLGAFQLVQKIH